MPFNQFKPLSYGNVVGIPCAWTFDGVRDFDGYERKLVYGRAKITDALQTNLPLFIPSDRISQTEFPDKPFTLEAGSIINYIGIRLPNYPLVGEESGVYGLLPRNVTMIGTTGENLKVSPTTGTTHTVTSPVIVAASNAYAPDGSAQLARAPGQADQASPSLITTLGADTTFQVTISNAGNAAAGNGIRLSRSGAEAFILVTMFVSSPMKPLRMEEINLPMRTTV